MKPIRMPAEIKDKWLTALRSGEYKQARGTLCDEGRIGGVGYCCLGVLQKIVSGDVERFADNGKPMGEPTQDWLNNNNIQFFDLGSNNRYLADATNPSFESDEHGLTSAAELNDAGSTFAEIADILEPLIETN